MPKTAGTYDEIGTITVKKGANYILGFYALVLNTKPTANEASSPILKIESADLGVNMTMGVGTIGAEGMAALFYDEFINCRDQAGLVVPVFHMWSPKKTNQDLWHAEITFSVTGVVACTEGFDCAIQLVTADSQPDADLKAQLLAGHAGAWTGTNHGIEAAGAGNSATLAAWGSTNADQPRVDGGASSITGILYTINANAETAAKLGVAYS